MVTNSKENRELNGLAVLISLLFFLLVLSCEKDEINQKSAIMDETVSAFFQELSNTSVLYFPSKTFSIVSKGPVIQQRSLTNKNFKYFENFVLRVQNGSSNRTKVQFVEILIDRIPIIVNSDFRKNTSLISKPLPKLTASSNIEIRLDGSKGRYIKVRIECSLRPDVITDVDGNYYHTVLIGDQKWMAENLKTKRYLNGEPIATSGIPDISSESAPKYQWAYEMNEENAEIYGRLYTGYAILDSRGVCPSGWHVSSENDWKKLESFLGISPEYNDGLTSRALYGSGWPSGTNGTNASGFSALPAGIRGLYFYSHLGNYAYWWTNSFVPYKPQFLFSRVLVPEGVGLCEIHDPLHMGLSVRCVKN